LVGNDGFFSGKNSLFFEEFEKNQILEKEILNGSKNS
jgi:hypothetical protein